MDLIDLLVDFETFELVADFAAETAFEDCSIACIAASLACTASFDPENQILSKNPGSLEH